MKSRLFRGLIVAYWGERGSYDFDGNTMPSLMIVAYWGERGSYDQQNKISNAR
jgi:hypothetical protein